MFTAKKLHDKCNGIGFTDEDKVFLRAEKCDRIVDGICAVYEFPESKWREGCINRCPMSSHFRPDLVVQKEVKRVGQQKQGKKKKKH